MSKNKQRIWTVYADIPYSLWLSFKEKCDVDKVDEIITQAIKDEVDRSE